MPFCISEVRHAVFPNDAVVSTALSGLGLSLDDLIAAFQTYVCPATPQTGRGYQLDLAADLEQYLEGAVRRDGLRATRRRQELTYSSSLDRHADFGLVHDASGRRVLFEVEFRPDVERDLVQFQIGANGGVLALGVMIVTIDRKALNPADTTMPEYGPVLKVVSEFRPSYPLVVVGLRGAHAA